MKTKLTTYPLPVVLFFTFVLLLTTPEQGISQSQFRFGPLLGYFVNQHTSPLPTLDSPEAPTFPELRGTGISFGIQGEYYIDKTWSIAADAAYNDLRGSSELRVVAPTDDFYEVEYFNDGPPNSPIDTTGDKVLLHSANVTYSSVSLGFSGKWRFVADSSLRVGLQLGPTLHLITSKHFTQTVILENQLARFVNPSGFPTESHGKKLIFFNGDIPNHSPIRLGLRAGIFAEIGNDTSRTFFTPGIYYEFGATPVQKSSDWHVHRLGVQVALLFRL